MNTSETEREGIRLALPYLQRMCKPGAEPLDTNRAKNSELLQRTIGDYLVPCVDGKLESYDVKTEREYTGNLFVETWSNRAAGVWEKLGWIYTLRSDYLMAIYLDVKAAFVIPYGPLYEWCITSGNLYVGNYRERLVHRSANGQQRNQTIGYPVPFSHIVDKLRIQCLRYFPEAGWVNSRLVDIGTSGTGASSESQTRTAIHHHAPKANPQAAGNLFGSVHGDPQ